MAKKGPDILHRIDYTKWSVGTKVGKTGVIVVCLKCQKHGACELRKVKDGNTYKIEYANAVCHSGRIVEIMVPMVDKGRTVGQKRDMKHEMVEWCQEGPKL